MKKLSSIMAIACFGITLFSFNPAHAQSGQKTIERLRENMERSIAPTEENLKRSTSRATPSQWKCQWYNLADKGRLSLEQIIHFSVKSVGENQIVSIEEFNHVGITKLGVTKQGLKGIAKKNDGIRALLIRINEVGQLILELSNSNPDTSKIKSTTDSDLFVESLGFCNLQQQL